MWCSPGPAASGGQTVLANDRNGGRLRLIASRHDDDDDVVLSKDVSGTTGWLIGVVVRASRFVVEKLPVRLPAVPLLSSLGQLSLPSLRGR